MLRVRRQGSARTPHEQEHRRERKQVIPESGQTGACETFVLGKPRLRHPCLSAVVGVKDDSLLARGPSALATGFEMDSREALARWERSRRKRLLRHYVGPHELASALR